MERVFPILKKYSEKALNRTLKCSSGIFNTLDQEKIQRKGYKSGNYLDISLTFLSTCESKDVF